MAVYEKWQSERYSIGCKVWEARCPNCHYLVESTEHISSNYRFCPYCGFDMKSNFQRVADRRQFTECLMKLKEAKRLLKAAVEDMNSNDFCRKFDSCKVCAERYSISCEKKFKWRCTDEVKKLIKS